MSCIKSLIKGLQSDNDRIRFKNFSELLPIAQKNPDLLYPSWDILVSMLNKEEVSNKYYAICLLAETVRADRENLFSGIFDTFFRLIDHESPVVSPNIAAASGKIVNANPGLENRITEKLLNTESSCGCRYPDLLRSYVIQAFGEYFAIISDKKRVIKFVKNQLTSSSPKTRKTARQFLKTHSD